MTPSLLLRNVTVIDGLGGAPRPAHDVLVTDGVFASISPTGSLPLPQVINPDSLTVLDGTGHTVLPGFFDCHVHVSTSPATDTLTSITEPESAKTLRAVPALRATLDAGVTSARDLAGADRRGGRDLGR